MNLFSLEEYSHFQLLHYLLLLLNFEDRERRISYSSKLAVYREQRYKEYRGYANSLQLFDAIFSLSLPATQFHSCYSTIINREIQKLESLKQRSCESVEMPIFVSLLVTRRSRIEHLVVSTLTGLAFLYLASRCIQYFPNQSISVSYSTFNRIYLSRYKRER